MSLRIDLINLGGTPGIGRPWALGEQWSSHRTPAAVSDAASRIMTGANGVLCLDARFPLPSADLIEELFAGPGDAWHAGLRLGLGGHPRLLDHVHPLWMLNAPLDPDQASTSWRVSLRAVLARATVLDQLGGPDPSMETLAGSGLDLGHRWIRAGALVRHEPRLAPADASADAPPTDADGLRLIAGHDGPKWACWALQRAVTNGDLSLHRALPLIRAPFRTPPVSCPPFVAPVRPPGSTERTVSVVVPTLDRYAYLVPLLHQLAAQTVPAREVIVVDQTAAPDRRHDLDSVEPSLRVQVITLPEPGQSTARNAALRVASGELILFVDDDDEIGPDLIAEHLHRLGDGIDAISGGVDDAEAGPPPPGFRHRRPSDVFPTNNSMLRRSALERSGLFDLAYDHGSRADHDLGMRLQQAGAVLMYDPTVQIFHHHASGGGLRAHGARKVTRSSARQSVTQRHLPAVTELYLGLRYFSERQNREARAIAILSLVTGDGGVGRRMLRAALQLARLPSSIQAVRGRAGEAVALLADRPPIPTLDRALPRGPRP